MATYYVDGANGNDGDDGTDPFPQGGGVGPKATWNGAEDIPVAATDIVWIRSGVYREMLTVDVSGNAGAGNEILYRGDVAGEIWGVGGIVRITGSDNDQTTARNNVIIANDKDYRTFRGFMMDTCAQEVIDCSTGCANWIIEDCAFQNGAVNNNVIYTRGAPLNWTIRRCVWIAARTSAIYIDAAAETDSSGHLIENCMFLGIRGDGIGIVRMGDMTIKNCTFISVQDDCIDVLISPNVGHPVLVYNCIFANSSANALEAQALTDMTENYNTFYGNQVDRTNVNVGANSVTYPPLFLPPLLHAGASQISGFEFPWWMGKLSEWSEVRALTGSSEPAVDLRGVVRPVTASKNSWGPMQFMDMERETGTVHAGSVSMALHDAGRHQIWVPVANESTTISIYVYREANYAGNLPQMIVKQPGQADDVTTDIAAASQWNLLTTTLTPAADPPYVVVELISRNTNGAADEVFFDDLVVN